MTYLQCPDCRLTVPASTYYLRGDRCPRCRTTMQPRATLRDDLPRAAMMRDGARGLDRDRAKDAAASA